MHKNARILICGAGVAGLTTAIWLGHHGLRPLVVEQADDVRADGYIVSLSHRSYHFAERLGLLPQIRQRAAGVRASSYHRAGGATLLEFDYRRLFDGVDVVQIMRDDLQDILYQHARDLAEFRFGTTVTAIAPHTEGSAVTFNDGRVETYDAVIGADGLHSTIRRLSFQPGEVTHHALGLCCAAYRLPNFGGLRHKFETHMERDRYMVIFTTPDERLAAVFVWQSALLAAPPPAQRTATLQQAYAGSPALIQTVLAYCPPDGCMYMDPLIQVRMHDWNRDHAVLVGDAAHCMTLISGQGATMAFTGACVLAEQLIALPAEAAFRAYQNDLQATVFEVQDRTRDMARWYVPRSIWRQTARDAAMWLLPSRYFERHFQLKYSRA